MATNEQTRRVEIPNVQPPRMTPRPGVPPKPMAKKNSNDGIWMAGLAALMGVGLGVAGTAIASNSDEDPVDAANQVRDAEDQIDRVLDESQEAVEQTADEAKPVVDEEVIVEHHHHYHDRPVPPPVGFTDEEIVQGGGTPSGNDDVEIEVMGYAREMDQEGNLYDVAYIKVGSEYGIIMDGDFDGIADNLIMDFDGSGDISQEEIVNLKEAGISDVAMQPFAQEVNFDFTDMEPHTAYASAYMPEGTETGSDYLVSNDEGPDYTTDSLEKADDEVISTDDDVKEVEGAQFVSNDDVISSDDVIELGGTDDSGDVIYADIDDSSLTTDDEELLASTDSEELAVDVDTTPEDVDMTPMDDGSDMAGVDDGLDTSFV